MPNQTFLSAILSPCSVWRLANPTLPMCYVVNTKCLKCLTGKRMRRGNFSWGKNCVFFFNLPCPSCSCCCRVKSISEGSIQGCLLEKHDSEGLFILKHDEGRLEDFPYITASQMSTSPCFCHGVNWGDCVRLTMSPVSSEGETSERLALNNDLASKDTSGRDTIDCWEVTGSWNFAPQPTSETLSETPALVGPRTFLSCYFLSCYWFLLLRWLILGVSATSSGYVKIIQNYWIPVNTILSFQSHLDNKWTDC